MTHEPRDDERDLRKLFREARRAEIRRAPGFETILKRTDRIRPSSFGPRRLLAIGFSTAVIASLAVLGSAWILVPGPGPDPAPVLTATTGPVAQESSPKEPTLRSLEAPDVEEEVTELRYVATLPSPEPAGSEPETTQDDKIAVARERLERALGRTGAISIEVTTPNGNPLPAATVTISHPAGYVEESATLTDAKGKAEFPVLRATGQRKVGYTIEVGFPGFAPMKLIDVKAGLGETTELPVQLSGQVIEGVAVVSKIDVVALEDTSQATKFTDEYIEDLPVPGRFYENVLTLALGIQDADGDGNPNVHGSRDRDFKAVVSGVSNVAPLTGQQLIRIAREPGAKDVELRPRSEPWNAEGYRPIEDNSYLAVIENPLSTFSIDVDTASYANVRRFLTAGALPPPDAVRIEELLNYFDYDYPAPTGDAPFSTDVEIVDCPWNPAHRLARIGIKGREIVRSEHSGSNLVFLIDVSGSMDHPSKLPLLKSALLLLVEQLTSRDQVAIVAYAGSSGLVLDSTSGDSKNEILDAIDRLGARGSTNGGAGLRLAYRVARENFIAGGVNRVILATDGDFNVGTTSQSALLRSIENDSKEGIFLTALGFGYGNYQDDRLEHLADKGNGNYAYIDRLSEARKVLVDELTGTLFTIAKDVKIQVEFNPLEVGAYRLIGYENRMLKKEDFNDDRKDAGEIGAGHTVTALYELVPPGMVDDLPDVDELRYQTVTDVSKEADSGETFTLKLRYKDPEGEESRLLAFPITDEGHAMEAASPDLRFAVAVAQFGLLLRDSEHKGTASFRSVEKLALEGAGADKHGYRAEFFDLVTKAEALVDPR